MTRALVLHPVIEGAPKGPRTPETRLEEAVGLARALDLDIVAAEVAPLARARAGALFGSGKTDRYAERVAEDEVGLVIVDHPLTPVQQRNLEKAWKTKVLDRTGLILEIFGARARTREGAMQVELAHLEYQKSRLVRSWTHLERQRGGVGFMGGPGETQIEADRRALADKISALKRRLEKVARTRALQRSARQRAPYPVVALVGYTNAGKSTLFNRLTAAEVLAEDMLFATLDPTMRAAKGPSGRAMVLSDTVGFISALPTELVAAFRATLEEVRAADVVIHVRDVSDPETEAQRSDVHEVMGALGFSAGELALEESGRVIEAWNKIDRLSEFDRAALGNTAERLGCAVPISAATGEGVDALLTLVEARLTADSRELELALGAEDAAAAAWLFERGCVLDSGVLEDGRRRLRVRLSPLDAGRFAKRFGALEPRMALAAE